MDAYDAFLTRFVRVADDTKDPCEREEDDVNEHMTGHRDRPHSRNDAGVGLPATWNRRKRVLQEDSDVTSDIRVDTDSDMSLNYKAAAKKDPSKKSKDDESPRGLTARIKGLKARVGKESSKLSKNFIPLADKLVQLSKSDPTKCSHLINEYGKQIDDSTAQHLTELRSATKLPEFISEAWNRSDDVLRRTGMLIALKKVANKSNLPAAIKVPLMTNLGSQVKSLGAMKAILGPGEKITAVPEIEVKRFVALIAACRILAKNPPTTTAKEIRDPETSKVVLQQVQAVSDLAKVMNVWQKAISQFKTDESGNVDVSAGNWGAVLEKINGFMTRSAPPVDPGRFLGAIARQLEEKHGEIPREIAAMIEGTKKELPEDKDGEESGQEESSEEYGDSGDTDQKREGPSEGQDQGSWPWESPEEEKVRDAEMRDAVKELSERRKQREESKEKPEKPEKPGKEKPEKKPFKMKAGPVREEQEQEKAPEKPGSPMFSISTRVSAASYEAACRRMQKTAAYHGMVYQGHPTDPPGAAARTYDKRYFGKEHYDSIIASAKDFLSEDWLKNGWGENPGDVPVRAALDLAIHTADSGLYQSKIDAITYNMLLNRLAGWDFDVFNETLFAGPKARKASVMVRTSSAHAILKIADELRSTHPSLSIQIIKNVHAIMRTAAEPAEVDQGQGQAGRQDEERVMIEKVFNQVRKDRGLAPLQGTELKKLVEEAMAGLAEGSAKISAMDDAQMLSVMIHMAYSQPKYRKYFPVVLAAAKKLKDKKKVSDKDKDKSKDKDKDKSKKETAPKPSFPVPPKSKKDKGKKDKKEPTSKKRKADVIVASDINW